MSVAKIPFQPGLALGSLVIGDTIEKMNKYGEKLSVIEKVQQEMRELQQQLTILTEKAKVIREKQTPSPIDKQLESLFDLQIKALMNRQLVVLPGKLKEAMDLELPSFSNFTTGLEGPIDHDVTEVVTDSRGFDSINFNSQYIDMNESHQRIQDKMDQSSSSSSLNIGGGAFGFSASISHSWSSGAMKRVGEIRSQGHASKILVINAMVTTRNVRFFKHKKYDIVKLSSILDIMKASNDKNVLNGHGITLDGNKKCIYILTEAVLGGSFTAIVTYLKEDTTNREVNDNTSHSSSSMDLKAKGYFVKGGYSNSRQNANESHNDEINNRGNINVSIEFIAQGAIPQLAKDNIVREALKHQDQNLRKYQSSGSEGSSVQVRQVEMQKATYDAINTVQQIKVEKEEVNLHSVNSVIKAYDGFCNEITSDSSCGVPIGFNYTVLTQEAIQTMVGEVRSVQALQLETQKASSTIKSTAQIEDKKSNIISTSPKDVVKIETTAKK